MRAYGVGELGDWCDCEVGFERMMLCIGLGCQRTRGWSYGPLVAQQVSEPRVSVESY
jgi:hypothetical protein